MDDKELEAEIRRFVTPDDGEAIPADTWRGDCAFLLQLLDEARAEVERLREELEDERLRLAGCGVAAMANTERSYAEFDAGAYGSASLNDVRAAVRREIDLRAEVKRLTRQRDALVDAVHEGPTHGNECGCDWCENSRYALKLVKEDQP